ncbi:rhamnosyltransferase [Gloeobacter kilaueensis]|uniref:Rhamnosyltransferase n=1 Tax=Gloeobacter kilaueensis (strain ATCC BAA-2537 / CCAP 1431/1 / ULC 316 / JS1) TaxID=1183438 RepID=U5QMZ4_GLOK1|nr:rhamnosyltransferase [Gloeobacter kilaueensis]AGY59045.1 rhamnosyltransferase [Gloeobacter kilaueensis JS1]
MRFDILVRTCARVEAFTGRPRFIAVPKQELLLRCLHSLILSINACLQAYRAFEISLTVLDDHSDPQTVRRVRSLLGTAQVPTRFLTLAGTGNGQSLLENYEYARNHCPDLIYFCEDDYLHDRIAITEMLQTYDLLQPSFPNGLALHPCDYPDRYLAPYPSYIYLGSTRFWRTILHTTGTFAITNAVLRRYYEHYLAFTRYGIDPTISEDNSINRVYREVPCISPLPSLAIHLQYVHTLSPFVDWQAWWEAAQVPEPVQ